MSYLNIHWIVDDTNFHSRVDTICTPWLNTKTNFENTFMPTLRNLLLSLTISPNFLEKRKI
jgi:hypothetical protein